MREFIQKYTAPPIFEDEETNRIARLMNSSILLIVFGGIISTLLSIPFSLDYIGESPAILIAFLAIPLLLAGLGWWLRRLLFQGKIETVGWILSATLFVIITLNIIAFGGIRDASTAAYILVILLASLFLGGRAAIIFTITSVLALIFLFLAETTGLLQPRSRPEGATFNDWFIYFIIFLFIGFLIRFAVNSLSTALARARAGEQAAAEANAQLQNLNADLENRVAARTQALVTSAEISRRISTILETERLVNEVANEIRDAFNYYQVHVYLLDNKSQMLNLAAGAGVAGAELIARQHAVPINKGLIGRAARTNIPVLVPNVYEAEDWLPNELLPDTQAEIAVPIAIGRKVLGVLDVQQNKEGGLDKNDQDLLLSISGQVAIALENARLLTATQDRAEQEALINQVNQQIQNATTVEHALQVAVREIGRAVKAPETRIRLGTGRPFLPESGQKTER